MQLGPVLAYRTIIHVERSRFVTRMPARFLCALATSSCIRLLSATDSAVVLLQSTVHVHGSEATLLDEEATLHEEFAQFEEQGLEEQGAELDADRAFSSIGQFYVDNSRLNHKGPGVLWRQSKDLNSTVGRTKFAAWGSVLEGHSTGDGWIKVGSLYLPTHIGGVPVVIPRQQSPARKKLRISFKPTSLQAPDGNWIPCQIIGLGRRPATYNIRVIPPSFASYNMSDVPVRLLKKVQIVRQFLPTASHLALPEKRKKTLPTDTAELDNQGFIEVKVNDLDGSILELKALKKSPLRTVMKMACTRMLLSWSRCQREVDFIRGGVRLAEDRHSFDLGMRDGETIHMQRKTL
eukprot:CAMPEP_0171108838 /NCGR_PEP_ID=MMETSP0766_2-20121228/69728_1 /TAXON_ID=439317 /ORGANISM="Gambierdiscus australes, Strain CAWD 149" /LENGTH=348 /DNA_ID=CAMNT_0011570449 /DNA_START=15 /DNA_END=1061 /DNA_ORIENTATION=+